MTLHTPGFKGKEIPPIPQRADAIRIDIREAERSATATQRTIQIKGGSLADNADESERVLRAADVPFFRQRGTLVRPSRCTLRDSKGIEVTTPAIVEVTVPMLRDELCRHAAWERYDVRSKKWGPTDPPKGVAEVVLSRGGEGGDWRTLAAVSATPFIRRDASIVSKPGYDEATGAFLLDPIALPAMPTRPTKADAMSSSETIKGLLAEFPFVDEPARSVAASGMMTPLARPAIGIAPITVASAPQPGTGKSFLWNIAAAIAQGVSCPVIAIAPDDKKETEKRLVARVLDGTPMFSLDNVNGTLEGDLLCQLGSEAIVSPRILGQSKSPQVTNRFTVYATGNNISLSTDLVRRVIFCRMDARTEKTYERKFKANPVATVLADRGRYIAACLTIMRAHALAGYPGTKDLPAFNGFEDWSRMVRAALVWLSWSDPVLTVGAANVEDSETAERREFVYLVAKVFGTGPAQGRTIASMAHDAAHLNTYDDPDKAENRQALNLFLKSHFCDHNGSVNTRRAGKWLGKIKERVFDNLRLENDGSTKTGCKWHVSKL